VPAGIVFKQGMKSLFNLEVGSDFYVLDIDVINIFFVTLNILNKETSRLRDLLD
jgi:hypothetical protein